MFFFFLPEIFSFQFYFTRNCLFIADCVCVLIVERFRRIPGELKEILECD